MKNKRTIMTGNNFFFWRRSVQTSKLLICRTSILNSFSTVFFLFCPTSVSYWIATYHKDTLCRYIPGKNGDWKTSDLTKTTVCSEQQHERVNDAPTEFFFLLIFIGELTSKWLSANCHNIHILWFWNRRSVQDLLDEFPQKSGFLFPSPALVNASSFH